MLHVGQITAHHVRTYLASLQRRGLKYTTQQAQAGGIKAWLNWLVREGDLDESPVRRVAIQRLEKRIRAPSTPSGVRGLLTQCNGKTLIGARNCASIGVA